MLQEYRFKILGVTPLLMHAPTAMGSNGSSPKRKEVPPPEEEAERGAYRTPEGYLCFPAIAFRNAALKVAGQYRSGKKSYKSLLAHIRTADEFVIMRHPETWEPLTSYAIDTRRAVVQGQGVIRARPRLDAWACEVGLLGDDEIGVRDMDKVLLQFLNEAGGTIGVGDFRLEKGGWFGLFRAELA